MQGRVVSFAAPRRVEIAPVEVPAPGPGQVTVRTCWSGISPGTELLAYRGEIDPDLALDERLGALSGTFRFPFSYGYSCVGRLVTAGPTLPAGTPVFAFHPHQDLFRAAEADLVPLPAGVDARTATLFPLVETALQLSLDAGAVAGEPVVVTGLGPVGLLTALLLGRAGADVLCSEPLAWRRGLAATLELAAVPPADLPGRVAEVGAGRGVPLLVETSGQPAALAAGLDLLAHEGVALVGSWYGRRPVALPLGGAFHRRRLQIRSSQVSTIPARLSARWDPPRRRRRAAELLSELPLAALATTAVPFAEAASAYAALDAGRDGVLHVALGYD